MSAIMDYSSSGNIVAIACVLLSFVAFALPLVLRRRPETSPSPTAKRDRVSFLGILLQGVGFAVVFFGPVQIPTPIAIDTPAINKSWTVFSTITLA